MGGTLTHAFETPWQRSADIYIYIYLCMQLGFTIQASMVSGKTVDVKGWARTDSRCSHECVFIRDFEYSGESFLYFKWCIQHTRLSSNSPPMPRDKERGPPPV